MLKPDETIIFFIIVIVIVIVMFVFNENKSVKELHLVDESKQYNIILRQQCAGNHRVNNNTKLLLVHLIKTSPTETNHNIQYLLVDLLFISNGNKAWILLIMWYNTIQYNKQFILRRISDKFDDDDDDDDDRVPSRTWKTWRFEYYLFRSRNCLEFIPKRSENLDKKQEI